MMISVDLNLTKTWRVINLVYFFQILALCVCVTVSLCLERRLAWRYRYWCKPQPCWKVGGDSKFGLYRESERNPQNCMTKTLNLQNNHQLFSAPMFFLLDPANWYIPKLMSKSLQCHFPMTTHPPGIQGRPDSWMDDIAAEVAEKHHPC